MHVRGSLHFNLPRLPQVLASFVVVLACYPQPVAAQINVAASSESELISAILAANAAPTGSANRITLTDDISLSRSLPMISSNVTFAGNGFVIDANSAGRVFFVQAGVVSISDLTVANALAVGGAGGPGTVLDQSTAAGSPGGGGGLGAGAALFVNTAASVTVSNVTISGAQAIGGMAASAQSVPYFEVPDEASGGGAGGGGIGGQGGSASTGDTGSFGGGGGGGGYNGTGGGGDGFFGGCGDGFSGGGGGGGGQFGAGGHSFASGGGGGGGATDDGDDNETSFAVAGGGAEGGIGAATGNPGGAAPALGGGGGGGGTTGLGGAGNVGGGGGGGGAGADGGAGGDFGGGGGAGTGGAGGAGGFGAGGGSGGFIDDSVVGQGGAGGFGGGGGGGSTGGAAGAFGGQGGTGMSADGGGGAALGGAVFVRAGGVLIISDGTFSGTLGVRGGATGGAGGATAGQAQGRLGFVMGAEGGATDGNLTLAVSAGSITIDEDDALAGAGALVKAGNGLLVLGGANTNFAGRLDITGGTLGFGQGGSLSAQTAVSVTSGTFDLNNTDQTIGSLAGAGSVRLGSGDLTTGALNTSTTFSGVISGSGSLRKLGAGTMTLGGANIYSGDTIVAAGTLQFVSGGSVSDQTAATVLSGATLDLNGTTQTVGSLAGGGSVLLGTGALAAGANNTSTLFSGVISGPGAFTKTGTGTMTLSGVSTYTGATTVAAGTLRFDGAGSLSAATAVSVLGGATLDLNNTTQTIGSLAGAGNVLMGAGALTVGGNNASTIFTGVISGGDASAFNKIGAGVLTLGGINTFTGPTTISGGTLRLEGGSLSSVTAVNVASGAAFDLANTTQVIGSLSGGGSVLLGNGLLVSGGTNASTTFSGAMSGAGSFVKAGTGTMMLAGANSHTGLTAIAQGRLQLAGGSLSNFTTVAIAGGATLDLNGAAQSIAGLAGDGEVQLGGGRLTVGGTGASSVFGGSVSGQGSLAKAGSGMLALVGANSYTGGTFLQGGTLLVGSDANLGASESELIFDGGTLQLANNFTSNRTVMLNSGGGIDTNGFQVRLDGLVDGPGTLTKTGAGVLTLTNTNSYTGGTEILQGALVGNSGSVRGPIRNESLLNFDQPFDGEHSGNIRGSGALLKSGTGRLTLTGTNTYTGGTAVTAGTLAGTSNSLRGDILNDARLVFDQAFDGTFDGTLFGSGAMVKTGIGSLRLTGTHPFGGSSLVSQGTLALDGIMTGDVRVDPGATFSGSGAILGSLNLLGRLEVPALEASLAGVSHTTADNPGHRSAAEPISPNLMIGGTLTATPGSVIRLDLGPGANLPLGVEGRTLLNNTAFEVAFRNVADRTATYTALTSLGGLQASGLSASSVTPDLVPILTNDGNSVLLTLLNFAVPLSSVSTTPNTASVGRAVDAVKREATGDLGQVVRELIALDDASLDTALESLAGQVHASQQWLAVLDSETFTDMIRQEITLRDHASEDDLANPAFAPRAQQMRWWAQIAGEHATFTGDGFRGGFANLGGAGGGFDVKRTDRWLFGFGGSYSAAGLSLDGLGGGSDLKAPRGFAYSGVRLGRFRLHAGGSSARTSYQTTRQIIFAATVPNATGGLSLLDEGVDREATSEQHGWAHDAWSEWQDSIKIKNWTLDSKVGWRHVRFTRENWVEQGAGDISLEAPAQTMKLTEADATVHVFKRTGGIRPRALFTYKRELFEDGSDVALQFVDQPEARFSTTGLPVGKDTITALGGLTFMTESGLEYAIRYEVRHKTGELRQKFAFRVRFR